jgi:adenylylsulfate reductase subunit B
MSIAINQQKCRACGACMNVCPGSLIKKDGDGKAFMKYPRDCWGCSSCIKECRFGAISFFLGADIGGRGSRMSTKIDGDLVDWNIEGTDGIVKTITINRRDANKY